MIRHFVSMAGVALLASLGCPLDALAESVQFSGSLVSVTRHSVWVRQTNGVVTFARLPDTGDLSAQTLVGRYRLGQQVLAKAATIPGLWDSVDGQYYLLELKAFTYLRAASEQEVASALGSAARRMKGNLLSVPDSHGSAPNASLATIQRPNASPTPPGHEEFALKLEHSRELARHYLETLPNFNANETSELSFSPVSSTPKWRLSEKLESEVSFQGASATHRNVVRNGKAWNDTFAHLPPDARATPNHWILDIIFNLDCDVTLDFAKRDTVAGTPVLVYRFTAPPETCFPPPWGGPGERYFAGRSGTVSFAEADGLVRRLEVKTTGFPKDYWTQMVEIAGAWGYIKIGGEGYLLPVQAETLSVRRDNTMSLSVSKYTDHRHFEAFTNITYK